MHRETDTLSSSMKTMDESTGLESLGKSLKLIIPSTVLECREKGLVELTTKARNESIKTSLVILQASIGSVNPSHSEFVLCAQKLVQLIPELKDPLPPIRREAFKEWVSGWLPKNLMKWCGPVNTLWYQYCNNLVNYILSGHSIVPFKEGILQQKTCYKSKKNQGRINTRDQFNGRRTWHAAQNWNEC